MSDYLITEFSAGVATLTVNRPEHRNATSPDMLQDMAAFLATAESDPETRCVVITGAGDNFIGGGDIKSFAPTLELSPQERGATYERRIMAVSHLYHRLERLQKPVVVIARGAIAGAGVTFALAADLTIVSDTTYFFFAHGQLGLSLDGGVSYYLPRVVGWRKAKELALLNARVAAPEALELGLASRVVPDAALEQEADKYIQQLKSGPTRAMGLTKSLLENSLGNTINQQIRLESEACASCTSSEDFREGVSAFLDKRKPVFCGH
jgi:2-(1,2-epoxy-1,2-dihydrophenyl)acetyl-CoA isomerase